MSRAKTTTIEPSATPPASTTLPDAQRVNVRLECLKLAIARQGANDPRDLLDIAWEYESWIYRRENGAGGVAPAADPPAAAPAPQGGSGK